MTPFPLDPAVAQMASLHATTDPNFVHTDLDYVACGCRNGVVSQMPNTTGDTCASCGGMAVRTGTCTTCVECGTTGGCG